MNEKRRKIKISGREYQTVQTAKRIEYGDISKKIKASAGYYYLIERGKVYPSVTKIFKIADILQIKEKDLF